jgi:hypothetical protein
MMFEIVLIVVATVEAAASVFFFYETRQLAIEVKQWKEDALLHSKMSEGHAKAAMGHAELAQNHARVGLEFSMATASRFASSQFKAVPTPETSLPPPPTSAERPLKEKRTSEDTLRVARQILQTPNVNW